VGTPSNFGTLGERPTHPELLDYLTARFVADGWSLKKLHRQIMLSATYQLSSRYDEANAQVDADNRFLWRMNRRRLGLSRGGPRCPPSPTTSPPRRAGRRWTWHPRPTTAARSTGRSAGTTSTRCCGCSTSRTRT